MPTVRELERLCGGEGRGADEPRTFRIAYARLVRKISIRITWLLLHTPLSANQVTLLGVLIGIVGAALLSWNNLWAFAAAVTLLQLSFVVDFSDGEVARYRNESGGGGAYLDWIGHYYIPAVVVATTAYAAWLDSGHQWLFLAALILILGLVRIPYSARDHVLLGLYRDYPELRNADKFNRAALARQGGDPDEVRIDADYAQRRAGSGGRGVLWRRYTNLGQVLVYPGFVNLVTLALAIDAIVSLAGGNYPRVSESLARQLLIGVLSIVQLAHQLRAAAQSFTILKRL